MERIYDFRLISGNKACETFLVHH